MYNQRPNFEKAEVKQPKPYSITKNTDNVFENKQVKF